MSSDIAEAIGAALGRLFELAAADQTLRARLRDIAQAFLETTESALHTSAASAAACTPAVAEALQRASGKTILNVELGSEHSAGSSTAASSATKTPAIPPADLISAR